MHGDRAGGNAARAVVALGLVLYCTAVSAQSGGFDFITFYAAGAAIRHPERQLYRVGALTDNPFGPVFKLPPSAAMYLAPLTLSRIDRAERIWQGMLSLAYWASFALIARSFGVRLLSWTWLAGVAAWALFAPAHESIGAGQWDPIFLLLLTLGMVMARSGSPVAALPIALAATVKPHPILALLYFGARRHWLTVWASGAAIAILLGIGAVVAGAEETETYLMHVLPVTGVTTAYPDNQSLGGVIARLATDDLRPVPLRNTPVADWSIRIVALALGGAVTVLLVHARADVPGDRAMLYAITVPLMVLVIPVAWTHYLTVLLLPLYLLVIVQAREQPGLDPGWFVLLAAYILLVLPGPVTLIGGDINPGYWSAEGIPENLPMAAYFPTSLSRLLLSYQTLGALLVLGCLATRIGLDARRTTSSTTPGRAESRLASSAEGA